MSQPSNLLISKEHDVSGQRPYDVFHAFYTETYTAYDPSKDASKVVNAAACQNTYWWQEPIVIYRSEYVDYKVTVPDNTTDWQDEPLAPTQGLEVETRTLYRYNLSALGHSYVSGVCTLCGQLDPEAIIPGDLNGDKKVNSFDSNKLKRFILNGGCSEKELAAGDINGDKKLNSIDANLIKRIILGVKKTGNQE